MEKYDLLIKNVLIPEKEGEWDIAVKDGKIEKIGKNIVGEAKYTINGKGKIAFPSFANMHTHISMTLLRGLGADLPLHDWLQKVIWPLEGEFVSPEFVKDGALLGIVESIRSGTTLFMDMYFFEEAVAEACEDVGIRAGLGFGILDFPTKVAKTPEEYIQRARKFAEEFKNRELVFPVICPHAPYTCSPNTLRMAKELADEYGLLLHIHVAETKEEVERIKEQYGKTPVEHLESIGFLDKNVLCAHMVWTTEKEREILKERDVKIAHCPESNLKLASGIAPVPDYVKRGITVTLGTDGAASNDNLNMLEETSTCAKFHKGYNLDAKAIDAGTALKIATENGFKVAGIKAGKVEEGYEADLILVDTDFPEFQPLYDPISQFVYSANSECIDTVICKGKVLMEKRELKTVDQEEIFAKARKWREKILSKLSSL
ncbi:amidohydrolase [Aquifex aeolicus]|uniref:5-methylthioadenosine/S-adenosylhomocysteine deaminase n=1 Tax=Aquifex aeolicus (strain VF5) TaxID=224324 RepID=MTAD_AQUAE|nr:amidohydrolase [Aquifex aeolicus]O66851.1 RecName: Full=5-methylthioadenosine/S-adenosylhomocysteine deaminase; Short=MTA/SAH deaminase [Aquifex aeolicus VF5]AAC06815.1 N-ethylammeline chlorohydrolase [Aquifex aeolicus VF5]